MSSFNQKVAATTAVLKDSARQRRVTNRQELAAAVGAKLYDQGVKCTPDPIDRYKLVEVLGEVASKSFALDGILLPAIVVHYSDSRPGRRFAEWAGVAGAGSHVDHQQAVAEVFEAYGDSYSAGFFPSVLLEDQYGEEVDDDDPIINSRDADEGD